MKQANSILIVGGGTAGLVTALILKKKLNVKIDILHSKNIGIIGVGEGSTEHWKEFCNFVGINQLDLLNECDATYKAGIMFKGWNDRDYLHSIGASFSSTIGQYSHVFGRQIGYGDHYICPTHFWHSKIPKLIINKPEAWPTNQFHFNTHKLNEFLLKIARSLGIDIIEDEIDQVHLNNQGEVDKLTGTIKDYAYDFYIDSTGFKRLLINKLGAKWNSFNKYLKMKSAIAFPTDNTENYNIWTTAQTMDNGWMFSLPVQGRNGNGYIFDSDYITAEQAKQEVETTLGYEIDVRREFKFDPGSLETAWIKNCCAVGLSASFVEPLEASSIGTSIQQAFLLMHNLPFYNEATVKKYNKAFNDISENIRDFIALHYITKKSNTEFWKDVSKIDIPDSLKCNLEIWKHRLPIQEDFNNLSRYILFSASHFIMVMEGLDLFDKLSIRNEFESNSKIIKQQADDIIRRQWLEDTKLDFINHKKFIEITKEYINAS